ncbi:MAG: fibronectin type III domain-containing protein [Bacteroidetes bacterium]|nr:fibronectin type III domain-containing protein [Bacteroidota bacterium]
MRTARCTVIVAVNAFCLVVMSTFHLQAQWSLDPNVNTAVCTLTRGNDNLDICSDGSGGAIIAMNATIPPPVSEKDVWAQRLDASGYIQWTPSGTPISIPTGYHQYYPRVCGDGAGGSIVVWSDDHEQKLLAQRVNGNGATQWASGGILLYNAVQNGIAQGAKIPVTDGAGGAIVAWAENRGNGYDIFAQRIDASGNVLWGSGAASVCTATGDQTLPFICSDGNGGAIIGWWDKRSGNIAEVYAQRIAPDGSSVWQNDGIGVCTGIDVSNQFDICPDGAGGAVIVWVDVRYSGSTLHTQRVDAGGSCLWQNNGVRVCSAQSYQVRPRIVALQGGAIVVWAVWQQPSNDHHLYSQYLHWNGTLAWDPLGIPICQSAGSKIEIVAAATTNGAIIAWTDRRNGGALVDWDMYAQGVMLDGSVAWQNDGLPVCIAADCQRGPVICADGTGAAIIAWVDRRNNNSSIYATRTPILAPLTPPAAPSGLAAVAVTPAGIRLEWRDNSDNEQSFVIEHRKAGGSWRVVQIQPANSTTVIVHGLEPEVLHFFRIKAVNPSYESAWSNEASATTPVFPAPANLSATAVASDAIDLVWEDNSAHETGFIVERKSTSTPWMATDTLGTNVTAVRIEHLQPATIYTFRVRAVEGTVSSALSNEATATTLVFPAPANLMATAVASDAIDLVWEDNSADETGFIVERKSTSTPWMATDTLGTNVTAVRIEHLQPATIYSFRVRAVKGTVCSALSNEATATTLLFLPTPTNLTVTILTANSVRLLWEDRADGESGFEIEQRQDAESWAFAVLASANATEQDISGLESEAKYAFRVRAVGTNASSSWSNEALVSTHLPPATPRDFSAVAVSYQEVELSWTPGSTNETGFEIERKIDSGDWMIAHATGAGITTLRDEHLREQTTYAYRIRAVNALGASPWSTDVSVTTPSLPAPGAPFGVSVVTTGVHSLRLTWVASSPPYQSGFEIQESTTGSEEDFVRVSPDAHADATSYLRTGLSPETRYYYRVRAFNANGNSPWSPVVTAATMKLDPQLPSVPTDVTARALGPDAIRIDWCLASPSNEEHIEIERSLTALDADFRSLDSTIIRGTLTYTDRGLQVHTTYFYRLRCRNQYGTSEYSPIAHTTTSTSEMSPELTSSIARKEVLLTGLEHRIEDGDESMRILREIFGDYPRGYDESPARELIDDWRTDVPIDQNMAAQSMTRFALFEETLRDAFDAPQRTPPLLGAREVAREAARPLSVLSRNLGALGQSWSEQRTLMSHPYVDVVMEDFLRMVYDGAQTLLTLMDVNADDDLLRFYVELLRETAAPGELNSVVLLSMNEYWQSRMLGRHYLTATQPLIEDFASRCGLMEVHGSTVQAEEKREEVLERIDAETALFAGQFSAYNAICTALDAAYAITNAPVADVPIFLRRLMQLRPRLIDGVTSGIAKAATPVTRALYLTGTNAFADVTPLPLRLRAAGELVFDPTAGGVPPAPGSSFFRLDAGARVDVRAMDAVEEDRGRLLTLRHAVDVADTMEIAREFVALRLSGRQLIGEIDRMLRPLYGLNPIVLHGDPSLRDEYNAVIGEAQLYKSRRALLSVALAEYVLTPAPLQQQDLLAEIDTLLQTAQLTLSSVEAMLQRTEGLVERPVLALDHGIVTADPASGSNRFRLRLTIHNTGVAAASDTKLHVHLLTSAVTLIGQGSHNLGTMPANSKQDIELEVEIPHDVAVLPFAVVTHAKNTGIFVDQCHLSVRQSSTGVFRPSIPKCILYQNFPNPCTTTTNIRFSVPTEAAVRVSVCDLLGRELRMLVDTRLTAGEHVLPFSPSGLSAGTYVYRMQSLGQRLERIMVLTD